MEKSNLYLISETVLLFPVFFYLLLSVIHLSSRKLVTFIHIVFLFTRVCLKTACAGLDVPLCGRQFAKNSKA